MEKQAIQDLMTAELNEALRLEKAKVKTNSLDHEYEEAKIKAMKGVYEEAQLALGKSKDSGEFLVLFMVTSEKQLTALKEARGAGKHESDRTTDRGDQNGKITSWDSLRKMCTSLSSQMAREASIKETKG